MSVTKTTFVSTTSADMVQELYTWLTANASGLFDDISLAEEGGDRPLVLCKKGGKAILKLSDNSSSATQHFTIFNSDGSKSRQSHSARYNSTCLFHSAYKTSNEIVLVPFEVSSGDNRKSSLFVSTDEDGSLMMAGKAYSADAGSINPELFIMSPEHETAWITKNAAEATFMKSEKTAFCEVLSLGGRKAPHLFYLPFTQYADETAEIYDGSKWYVTDGFFALEE